MSVSDIVIAVSAGVSAFSTATLALLTWRYLKHTRELVNLQRYPSFEICSVELCSATDSKTGEETSTRIDFEIKNIGTSAAYGIRVYVCIVVDRCLRGLVRDRIRPFPVAQRIPCLQTEERRRIEVCISDSLGRIQKQIQTANTTLDSLVEDYRRDLKRPRRWSSYFYPPRLQDALSQLPKVEIHLYCMNVLNEACKMVFSKRILPEDLATTEVPMVLTPWFTEYGPFVSRITQRRMRSSLLRIHAQDVETEALRYASGKVALHSEPPEERQVDNDC